MKTNEQLCLCKDRLLTGCPGEWEPGCDLGNNAAYVENDDLTIAYLTGFANGKKAAQPIQLTRNSLNRMEVPNAQNYSSGEFGELIEVAQPVQPAYPVGQVVGPCVCGSWPAGECLKCTWIPARPVQPTAWQPIETAPRTGVRVLYLSNKFGEYVGNHPPKCSPGDWYFIDGAWRGSANQQAWTATHWMPLPAPPTKE